MNLGPVLRKKTKQNKTYKTKQFENQINKTRNNFVCLFVFPPGTSLTEAANTVFMSGKQSMSSVPDLRTGKENYM